MIDKKVRVLSKNQSGGQTASSITNINITQVTNNYPINSSWDPLSGDPDDDARALIGLLVNEFNAKGIGDTLYGAWYTLELPALNLPVNNPDDLAQIAHSMREFIEKVPKILNTAPVATGTGLKNAVIGLSGKWSRAISNTRTVNTGDWSGEIDNPFKKVLSAFADFFGGFDASHTPRSQLNRAVLTRLNGAVRPLQEDQMKELLEQYKNIDDYFKRVAHHDTSITTDYAEMRSKIKELQAILLNLKYPSRTISGDNLDNLDALLLEGESS